MPAAEQLDLTLQTSDWFERTSGAGIAAENQVRQLAFSDEVMRQGLNSEAIELGNDRVVFIRLNELKPAQQQPLEQVQDTIRSELVMIKLRELNSSTGSEGLVALSAGKTLDDLAQEWSVSVNDRGFIERQQSDVGAAIRSRSFKMPKPETSAVYDGLSLSNGDYVIIELSAVLSNDDDVDQKTLDGLADAQSNTEYQAAMKMLSGRADVVRTPLEEL